MRGLKAAIADADGVLIISPEYNHTDPVSCRTRCELTAGACPR
jgi:hypothetical protein